MKFSAFFIGACAVLLQLPSEGYARANPGGTLDPLTISKYVTPLRIPPVMFDDMGGTGPLQISVALRQFDQQVLPAGFPPTTLWGYCDGSQPGTSTCSNPAFTIEVTQNTLSTVTWVNDLVDDEGNYLHHIIQDSNGDPVIDQTLYWAAPNGSLICGLPESRDCRGVTQDAALPYTGPVPMVVHLHGAHAASVSDGHPEAWWLPNANDIPATYFVTEGSRYGDTVGTSGGSVKAVISYTNDQPTGCLLYTSPSPRD